MQFRVKFNGEKVAHGFRAMRGRMEDPGPVLKDFGLRMTNFSIPRNFQEGGRPNKWVTGSWMRGEKSQLNRGQLMKSITYQVDNGKLIVGTNHISAAQRHFGGMIEAKKAKALVIPLPGTPEHMRPKDYGDDLFKMKSTKGDANTIGVLATESRGVVVPRYVLRRRLKKPQPARPFLMFQDEDMLYINEKLRAYVVEGR